MERAVRHYGYEALTADSGTPGLDLFRAHQQELGCILLDLVLPGLSGADVLAQIRSEAPGLPVVLLTGVHPNDASRRVETHQPDAVIQKPFGLDTLREALERLAG